MTPSGNGGAQEPLVTVALPAFNAEACVGRAVGSILRQTHANLELIVLDDGSSDATSEVVAEVEDSRVKLITYPVNRGRSRLLNDAVERAEGEFVARMDADDLAFPERLERQVAFLQRNPEIDLVGTGYLVFDRDGGIVGEGPVNLSHEEICRRPSRGFYLAHPTWTGRIEWFRRHRYRTESEPAEDQELLYRAFRVSRFANLPEVLLGYSEDRRTLAKRWTGRWAIVRTTVPWMLRAGSWREAAGLAGMNVAKMTGDAVYHLTGMDAARSPMRPVAPEVAERWTSVWSGACR